KAADGVKQVFLDEPRLTITETKEDALENADALVVCTEWQCFKAPNYELIMNKLKEPLIIDGRNLYDPVLLRQKGIEYIAVGRNNQRYFAHSA
ncbi:MAG TPA: UDP-glucose 6-dehydrogenase, partial [Gammaproteobacteria bacterium]|nr:UDP-glucose 6-dehydrogenase [Gammaproteobacteria bacterium]